MRCHQPFTSATALVLVTLVACNLHSGSGTDPDEIIDSGESGDGEHSAGQDAEPTGSSSGISGGGSGSSSGAGTPDATTPGSDGAVATGQCASQPSTCFQCCESMFPQDVVQTYASIAQSCLCNSGPCTSQCANELCIMQPYTTEGDLCQECVDSNIQPQTVCGKQCAQNALCEELASCLFQCPLGE
jgi:hypothetical protein